MIRTDLDDLKIENITKALYESMKGLGTDEDTIIEKITECNLIERNYIKKKYMAFYGQSLEDDFKSDLSGYFLETVLALFKNPYEYQAEWLNEACEGLGTNEKLLIQLICTKDAYEIKQLVAAYEDRFKKDIDKLITSEQKGDLGRILRSIVSGGRPGNNGFDQEIVKKEAQELYDAGQGKLGTDEHVFIRILCSRSFAQLNATFAYYKEMFKKDFGRVLRKELSGNLLLACETIYFSVVNKPTYFATLIKESMIGIGTRERDLIRLLVCRSYIDLPDICFAYRKFYKKNLSDDVISDTSGDFRKILIRIIGNH